MIGQPAAQYHTEQDRDDGGAFHHAVRPHQDSRAEHLREDAVFGRRIHGRADADQGVSGQRIDARHHGERAREFDQVRHQHHAPFGKSVRDLPDKGSEQDEGHNEGFLQQRHQMGQSLRFHDGDGRDQDGIVGQSGKELRRQHRHHAQRQQRHIQRFSLAHYVSSELLQLRNGFAGLQQRQSVPHWILHGTVNSVMRIFLADKTVWEPAEFTELRR